MKRILIISKDTGQTRKFINELPDYLTSSQPDLKIEFAIYPDHEEKAISQPWDVIGLSPELLIEAKGIQPRLRELGVNSPIKTIRGVHFGIRRYDLIFPALLEGVQ
ncbi:MAG: hypothetical protein FJZ98_06170 [Chloroflexi bacterium]|nr:hypothetical protein [Chloroflexota bacterium]